MPELPEVETIKRDLLRCKLKGKTIFKIRILSPQSIAIPSPKEFRKKILEKKIKDISRRGKYLIFTLSDNLSLLLHLRMTGHLIISSRSLPNKYIRVIFYLDDGRSLLLEDVRKLAKFYLTEEPGRYLNKLGLEPLEDSFSLNRFMMAIKKRKKNLKSLLLDQTFIAGIGNVYASEALWKARVSPQRSSCTLSSKEIKLLFWAIKGVLKAGIRNGGTSLGANRDNFYSVGRVFGENQNFLKVYGRQGQPCFRCQTFIKRIKIAQRSTFFCPHCQK